jgi:hypothetical protein
MMLVEGKHNRPGDGAHVSEEEHMSDERVIAVDLAAVYETEDKDNMIRILSWGDKVEVEETTEEHVRIRTTKFVEKPDGSIEPELASGFIVPSLALFTQSVWMVFSQKWNFRFTGLYEVRRTAPILC